MKNIKKGLVLSSIFILAISLAACKGKEPSPEVIVKQSTVNKDTNVVKTEPSIETPVKNTEVKNSELVEKADFTYSIIDETYTEEGITIKFPQLNKANNEAKADSVNKIIQESIRMKLDSLRMGQEDMGAFFVDLKYETTGYDNKVLSIVYQGTSNFEKSAYPANIYYMKNISLGEVDALTLKDIFVIDDNFIEAFKSGSYSPSRDDLDLEKSGVNIKETIESQYSNKDLMDYFEKQEVNYKLTMEGVILSIEVPHAIGDHLEMAIPYEAVEANMIKSSPVWKDYLFIK
jgi:hypothetical protein